VWVPRRAVLACVPGPARSGPDSVPTAPMPLFEYRCETCSHVVEILVRNGEQPACPECGEVHLQKLFSEPAAAVMGASAAGQSLPVTSACSPGPLPCSPTCCRLP